MIKFNFPLSEPSTRFSIVFLLFLTPIILVAQSPDEQSYSRDTFITVAKNIIKSTRFCALITLDDSGHPQARTMDPFSPEEDMTIWFGTNVKSRKVQEIRNDSRVTIYYEEPNGAGYVVVKGKAIIVDDQDKKEKYWKEEWATFYPDQRSTYTLIKVIPGEVELIDYNHGIKGDPETWAVPKVTFKSSK
jgi:general stress protein 26